MAEAKIADDDFVIEDIQPKGEAVEVILDDKAPAAKAAPVDGKIPEDEGVASLKAQVADAKRQTEAERQGRIAAEQRAREESSKRQNFETEAASGRYSTVANAIDAETRAAEAAERDYAAAMEKSDWASAAKAQRAIAKAEGRLNRLEESKASLEQQQRRTTEGRVQADEPIRVAADPVEALAAQLSPKSAAWLRQHPECATDSVLNSEMIAAHNRAVRNGIPAESPEYFEFIETRLGIGEPAAVRDTNGSRTVHADPPRRQAHAAPVSRDVPTNSGRLQSPRSITLSPEQREIARANGMSDQEYARELVALMQEGKLGSRAH